MKNKLICQSFRLSLRALASGVVFVAAASGNLRAQAAYDAHVDAGGNLTPVLIASNRSVPYETYTIKLDGDALFSGVYNVTAQSPQSLSIWGAENDGEFVTLSRTGTGASLTGYFNFNTASVTRTFSFYNMIIRTAENDSGSTYDFIYTPVAVKNLTFNFHNVIFHEKINTDLGGGSFFLEAGSSGTINSTGETGLVFSNSTSLAGTSSAGMMIRGTSASNMGVWTLNGDVAFIENSKTNGVGAGALLLAYFTDTTFQEGSEPILFYANSNTTTGSAGAGAIYSDGGSNTARNVLNFENGVTFDANSRKSTGGPGAGAIYTVDYTNASFSGKTVFQNNWADSTTAAGNAGAIYAAASSGFIFNGDTEFTNNWAKKTAASGYSAGAITLINSSASFNKATFTGNNSVGGLYSAGAITMSASTLNIGNDSSFVGNTSSTVGGAIYSIGASTINITGNVVFRGNYQNASFTYDPVSNAPIYTDGSGTNNAIHIRQSAAVSINLNADDGKTIGFYDPLTSDKYAAYVTTIRKTGAGTVEFDVYDSNIRAKTDVMEGAFRLVNGASYGFSGSGTAANNTFTLYSGATLIGGSDSELRGYTINLNGNIIVDKGKLKLLQSNGSNIAFSSSSTLTVSIFDSDNNSMLDFGGKGISGVNKEQIGFNVMFDADYMPSTMVELLDEFIICSNLAPNSTADYWAELFDKYGKTISYKGAEFLLVSTDTEVLLKQITAAPVPEPAQVAVFFGLLALGFSIYLRAYSG